MHQPPMALKRCCAQYFCHLVSHCCKPVSTVRVLNCEALAADHMNHPGSVELRHCRTQSPSLECIDFLGACQNKAWHTPCFHQPQIGAPLSLGLLTGRCSCYKLGHCRRSFWRRVPSTWQLPSFSFKRASLLLHMYIAHCNLVIQQWLKSSKLSQQCNSCLVQGLCCTNTDVTCHFVGTPQWWVVCDHAKCLSK